MFEWLRRLSSGGTDVARDSEPGAINAAAHVATAFAAACRLPAARLMREEPRPGWPAGACHFAPASVASVELCNLLVYADALRRAWLVVDGGRVGVLVEPEMD